MHSINAHMIYSRLARLTQRALVLVLVAFAVSSHAQTVITDDQDAPVIPLSTPPPLLSFVSPDTSLVARPNDTAEPQAPLPPPPLPMSIRLEATREVDAKPQVSFAATTPNIIIRWRGENLPIPGTVRVAWVAEDVGDLVDPGFVIDESRTAVESANFGGRFTLSRPHDGWAPGKYRVDLFVNGQLKDTLGVTIGE